MEIYKHKLTGDYLRLIKKRDSNINTYLQVDEKNTPIVKVRSWSVRPQEQRRLVTGFENLEVVNANV